MAENKKSFILYSDSKGLIDQLPDDIAGKLFKHIFAYVNDENPTSKDLLLNIAFESIKMHLKRDLKKYEKRAERSRINGSLGGRPKNPTKPKKPSRLIKNPTKPTGLIKNPDEPKKPDSVNDSVSVNVNDNDIIKTKQNSEFLEFVNLVSEYFFLTTEHQKMQVYTFVKNLTDFNEFKNQLQAYDNYKKLTKEKKHSWQSYQTEWNRENWVLKLKDELQNGKNKEFNRKKLQLTRQQIDNSDGRY